MEIKRGEVVMVAAPGDYGKPRPAVILQSDLVNDFYSSVVVCLITTADAKRPFSRVQVRPSAQNGLKRLSYLMVDKLMTVPREKLRGPIGRLDDKTMMLLNRSLIVMLGLTS